MTWFLYFIFFLYYIYYYNNTKSKLLYNVNCITRKLIQNDFLPIAFLVKTNNFLTIN